MKFSFRNIPLFWRVFLSTSLAITVILALTGWAVQTYAVRVSGQSLEQEVSTNLQTSEALWATRVRTLASISRIISSMSDVRAAFMTRDEATIRDTAQELWGRVSEENASFIVLDPTGKTIASLGGEFSDSLISGPSLKRAAMHFPNQVSGFLERDRRLLYVVLTPVYVQSGNDQALINILAVAFEVDSKFTAALKATTNGGDFVFLTSHRVIATTLSSTSTDPADYHFKPSKSFQRLKISGEDYLALGSPLRDINGMPIGQLLVLRSFTGARHALDELQRNVALIWFCAILIGLALVSLLTRRIIKPVRQLYLAASEVAKHNYDYRVPVTQMDELGQLAHTFNQMCDSIQRAREELIHHERIATIGRLSSSIVHDLRNPLAAIYGGAEMLIDSKLSPEQSKRLAASIYKASRRIDELLKDLVNVSRGKKGEVERCRLSDVLSTAQETVTSLADAHQVKLSCTVPDGIELPLERARMERVFVNMMNNALEAMPTGGELKVSAFRQEDSIVIEIDDTGIGISSELKKKLFQPFATAGKKNGLGLGLALARQTVLDHGGDLWAEEKLTPGARFRMRLPLQTPDHTGIGAAAR
jgi:signal transduction histidine kinase